jgi:hypothetical protein
VQNTANDNTRSSAAAEVASPTILEVLAAYLANEKHRLSAKSYGQYPKASAISSPP